ncbi:hypothetical protein Btru_012567 [Bulinus truncatus]|nr:hypothetical protein Btru_012567 [Bulinus truncatus]
MYAYCPVQTLECTPTALSKTLECTPTALSKPLNVRLLHCPNPEYGWVGVIRGCYRLGEHEGINDTNGCHNHSASEKNFTAIFCFCDTSYCNGAPSTIRTTTTTTPLQHWVILVLFSITLSAFVAGQEFALSRGG